LGPSLILNERTSCQQSLDGGKESKGGWRDSLGIKKRKSGFPEGGKETFLKGGKLTQSPSQSGEGRRDGLVDPEGGKRTIHPAEGDEKGIVSLPTFSGEGGRGLMGVSFLKMGKKGKGRKR